MKHTSLTLSGLDVKIQGNVERIIFHSEDNGYTVLSLRVENKYDVDTAVVVGYIPDPQVNMMLKITGEWVKHPQYGWQIQMKTFEVVLPDTEEGVQAYLASGLIKGIGKGIAARIVKKFGKDALRIFDENPNKLLEIQGISPNKLEEIKKCWEDSQSVRDLMRFLLPYGISLALAVRIHKYYEKKALQIVQENPYRLAMDVRGIGFLTADELAEKLGFAQEHPFLRAQAGVLYTLKKQSEDGHVYFPRDVLIQIASSELQIDQEMADQAITRLEAEKRLVLENLNGEEAVYLSRFHQYESQIAFYLANIMHSAKDVFFSDVRATLNQVVQGLGITLAKEQVQAVQMATHAKVMILTGGPGTGKTTILDAIIKVFDQAQNLDPKKKPKILLAAPTGRAAKRMSEAIGREAKTIHRLLEYSPVGDTFLRNEDNPLNCSLLVVDEVSMMDVMLAYHLFKATPAGATVILVGDIHQLPSVGPGNVLSDMIDSGVVPVVRLVQIFRQAAQSKIILGAHSINRGEIPPLITSLNEDSDFYFLPEEDPDAVADLIVDLVKNQLPARFGCKPMEDIQVLTPMHKGAVGTTKLNFLLQNALNPGPASIKRGDKQYRLGDKVMQLRNNYEKEVYNGDIGKIVAIDMKEEWLKINFDDRILKYDFEESEELTPAYAISIHKSQGSEYPAVVIPLLTQHYIMLQRNLVYTAVTRGKKLVVLVGDPRALTLAVHNNKKQTRYTWLAHRLAE